jgi:flagellin
MTSVLNNIAANTALLNLQNTVQNLQNTQQQISTGYKIGSAADNAAYFAISTVLQSDSNALSAVSDTLNLGASSLGVATSALAKIQTTLSDIKNQLIAATTPGVDRVKIQAQISQDQAQLASISNSANFNGQNFLSTDSSAANYNSTKSFVASFSRDAQGAITVGTIAVSVTNTALFDPAGGTAAGIFDKLDSTTTGTYTDASGTITGNATVAGVSIAGAGTAIDIHSLSDSANDQAMLNAYTKMVDAAIGAVASAASTIGTAQARITQQSSFVMSLQTSINDGVGNLVNADLNAASTRLQALQVQQQLGVQSLSIANQSTQMVLKLFQ